MPTPATINRRSPAPSCRWTRSIAAATRKVIASIAGEIIGTDNSDRKTRTLLCQEYVLQTDRITYRIRPKDDKHAALLPIGERAQFRIDKNLVKLRVEGFDDKEREYVVVSMTPRAEAQTADNRK